MESVTSRQNAIVKRFRALAASPAESDGLALLEGDHLVREALDAGIRITTAAVAQRLLDRASGEVNALVARLQLAGARVLVVSDAVMGAVSPVKSPSGIVAMAELSASPLERVMAGAPAFAVLVAGVQDPGNLGAIVRTAEAAGASGLVAVPPSAEPFGWKALRGAMGSTFRLPVAGRIPFEDAVLAARAKGLAVAAAVPRGGTPMHRFDFRRPLALVLGGEGGGLEAGQLDQADERISIPMKPPVESLNVAVSAAVILYEAARQRTHG